MENIGFIAGKIWHYLVSNQAEAQLLKLKFDLGLTNTELFLALGWLLREDKVFFIYDNNEVKVKLK